MASFFMQICGDPHAIIHMHKRKHEYSPFTFSFLLYIYILIKIMNHSILYQTLKLYAECLKVKK